MNRTGHSGTTKLKPTLFLALSILALPVAAISAEVATQKSVTESEALLGEYEYFSNLMKAIPLSKNNLAREILAEDFKIVKKALGYTTDVHLRVVSEFEPGSTAVARAYSEDNLIITLGYLAYWPKNQRLFILGHELGHVELRHNTKFLEFIKTGFEPTIDKTSFNKKMFSFTKKLELEADAFSVKLLLNEPMAAGGAENSTKYYCLPETERFNSAQSLLRNIYNVQGRAYTEDDVKCFSEEQTKYQDDNMRLVRYPKVLVRRSGSD